ncbi:MAG: hypothetical protein ACI96L_000389 [Paracoccaceae bacterium]|jgi:hypothetical protein
MRKALFWIFWSVVISGSAQNLEFLNDKDVRQPGKINPAFAGIQEDLIRIITDAKVGESYELMLEGKLPLRLGSYMVGVERLYNEDVLNNMFNVTYNRQRKSNKIFNWRYGGSLQFNQRSLTIPDFDSVSANYQFTDINGQINTVKNREDLLGAIESFDVEIGLSGNYKNLLFGISAKNIIGQNISFVNGEERRVPLTTNMIVGGFVNLGDKITFFPSALFSATQDDIYAKGSLDITTKRFNISSAYIRTDFIEQLNGTIGIKFKKTLVGLKYTHQITSAVTNEQPGFNLFLNTTMFKSRSLFKSDFAKQMKKLY